MVKTRVVGVGVIKKWGDYCNKEEDIICSRADSFRLCLKCDQEVHSTKALSLKHLRFQICHNFRSHLASVRCAIDNLLLCTLCNSDAHPPKSPTFASPFTHSPDAHLLLSLLLPGASTSRITKFITFFIPIIYGDDEEYDDNDDDKLNKGGVTTPDFTRNDFMVPCISS